MKYYSLNNKMDFKGNYGQICDDFIIEKQSKFISYLFKTLPLFHASITDWAVAATPLSISIPEAIV